jgi:hypothetical protein
MKTQDDLILEQLYTEGIFDRIKQRVHGAGSWLQGKGYNAGKTEKLNQTLKDRIKNDIDKFLKDIVTMGGITDLADFEKQYPHFAQKVACMAEAIGHTTALTTKCTAAPPPPPLKNAWCVKYAELIKRTVKRLKPKFKPGTPITKKMLLAQIRITLRSDKTQGKEFKSLNHEKGRRNIANCVATRLSTDGSVTIRP